MDDATLTTRINEQLARVPGWAWRSDGSVYTADEVAIFYGAIGPAPDRAIGVRVYGAPADIGGDGHLALRSAQLRFRGAKYRPNGADVLAGHALTVMQGLSRVDGINGIRRESFSSLGTDSNFREERADNYLIILDNQEASS